VHCQDPTKLLTYVRVLQTGEKGTAGYAMGTRPSTELRSGWPSTAVCVEPHGSRACRCRASGRSGTSRAMQRYVLMRVFLPFSRLRCGYVAATGGRSASCSRRDPFSHSFVLQSIRVFSAADFLKVREGRARHSRFEMGGNGSLACNPRKLGIQKPGVVACSLRWKKLSLDPDKHIVTMQIRHTFRPMTRGIR
jgi:hypothetical protein